MQYPPAALLYARGAGAVVSNSAAALSFHHRPVCRAARSNFGLIYLTLMLI
ncbi:MAG: hypothetical protein ABR886_09650 [Dehalococcoidales bacterium]